MLFLLSLHHLDHLVILLLPFSMYLDFFLLIFSNISVYYIFIFCVFYFSSLSINTKIIDLIQIFYFYIIQVFIQTIFHHSCEYIIWEFIYYLLIGIQTFPVSLSLISLCITSFFSLSIDISLTSFFLLYHFLNRILSDATLMLIIYKILHHNWGCVIWEFIYNITYLHNRWVCDIGDCCFLLYQTVQ